MPVWIGIVIAAMVVVAAVVLLAAVVVGRRKRTERLKQPFGPEYERTVAVAGERKAPGKEFAGRERMRDELDIVALPPTARHEYATRWRTVQSAFVDDPSTALGDADWLVTEVMRARGYPVDDFDRRAADISVDHPTVVENYRAADAIHAAQQHGDIGTETQRQAFVHYRALFFSKSCSNPTSTNTRRYTTPAPHRRQPHDHPRPTRRCTADLECLHVHRRAGADDRDVRAPGRVHAGR
jgi:hypothetical protein